MWNDINNLYPILWFDTINNFGNSHKQLTSTDSWKSLVNSDIYDAVTFGGTPSWNTNNVQFNGASSVYYIRQNGQSTGFWNKICNTYWSVHVVANMSTLATWYGICGGSENSLDLIGLAFRSGSSTVLNIGELYGILKRKNNVDIVTWDCPKSIVPINTIHCFDVIADNLKWYIYIDGILHIEYDLAQPYIFGQNYCFKIGSGWGAKTE